MPAPKTAIATERLVELKAQIAHMRKHPPAAGMGVTLQADEVEKMVTAIERNGYAELFALNQKQADTIDEFVRLRDEAQADIAEQREKIAALEAEAKISDGKIADLCAEIERLKNAPMGDDVVGDAPKPSN